MGVTLERVQNKFACIIGELCSEPIVLSQFAVWVDLRIAEYKTKGTISLDCSGESPNPGWMKGVKNNPPRGGSGAVDTGQGSHRRRGSYTSSPSVQMSPAASPLSNQMYNERLQSDSTRIQHNSGQQQNFQTRLSPDIVVIKNEPSPEGQESSSCAFSRKRSVDGGDMQSDFYSPAKSRRLGGPSALTSSSAQESSSNQSLMSIINTESESFTLEPVESEADIFKVTMDMQEELRKSQGLSASPSNSTFSPARRPTAAATSSSSSPNNQSWMGSTGEAGQGSSSQADPVVYTLTEGRPGDRPAGHVTVVRRRPSSGDPDPPDTDKTRSRRVVAKTTSSLTNIFTNWLKSHPRSETRDLIDIPPAELDTFLADFFANIKRRDGSNYLPKSFKTMREAITRHLKERGYPHYIVQSPLFRKSQMAFKIRFHDLRRDLVASRDAVPDNKTD